MAQALKKVVPVSFALGGAMELFMIKTGFYEIVTQKEAERLGDRLDAEEVREPAPTYASPPPPYMRSSCTAPITVSDSPNIICLPSLSPGGQAAAESPKDHPAQVITCVPNVK